MNALATAADEYALRGWHVLPIRPHSKIPATRHGWHDATSSPELIARWPTNANVGVACRPSGLVVLDFDPRNAGPDALHDLEQKLGALPDTPKVLTGGGGEHLYFERPNVELRGEIAPGVEIKDAGYVVAPPSTHPNGRRYEWDVHPDDAPVAKLPEAWLRAARQPTSAPARPAAATIAPGDDPLLRQTAATYIYALTGRTADGRGLVPCPFHKGGQEQNPSLKLYGTSWCCFACPRTPTGKHAGGTIYQFAGRLWGYPMPLRGPAFLRAQERLLDVMTAHFERRNAA